MDQPQTHDSTWARNVLYPRNLESAPHQDCRWVKSRLTEPFPTGHAHVWSVRHLHYSTEKAAWPQRNGEKDFDLWFPVPTLSSLSDLFALSALASLHMMRLPFITIKVFKLGI